MTLININGINTINHEIIPKPWAHNTLSKNVNINITQNLKKATVYRPLNVSITICVREKQTYINAGGHRVSIIIYIYIIIGKKERS
jgi:hypothetical protein